VDRDDIELINQTRIREDSMDAVDPAKDKAPPLWQWVRDGRVDAALLSPPASLFAKAAGLKVIDIEPLPMIQFTTVSSSLGFVKKHPDIVERFLKGLIEGIHYLKARPEESIKIIQQRCVKHGQMNLEQATITYQNLAGILEPKLYPKMQAIANVYEEAIRQDKDAKKVNPMELWDLHHIRHIDDIGFIDGLYGSRNAPGAAHPHTDGHPGFSKDVDGRITAMDSLPDLDCECGPSS